MLDTCRSGARPGDGAQHARATGHADRSRRPDQPAAGQGGRHGGFHQGRGSARDRQGAVPMRRRRDWPGCRCPEAAYAQNVAIRTGRQTRRPSSSSCAWITIPLSRLVPARPPGHSSGQAAGCRQDSPRICARICSVPNTLSLSSYEVVEEKGKTGVVLHVHEKAAGAQLPRSRADDEQRLQRQLRLQRAPGPVAIADQRDGGEVRYLLQLGDETGFLAEYYQPFGRAGTLFLLHARGIPIASPQHVRRFRQQDRGVRDEAGGRRRARSAGSLVTTGRCRSDCAASPAARTCISAIPPCPTSISTPARRYSMSRSIDSTASSFRAMGTRPRPATWSRAMHSVPIPNSTSSISTASPRKTFGDHSILLGHAVPRHHIRRGADTEPVPGRGISRALSASSPMN